MSERLVFDGLEHLVRPAENRCDPGQTVQPHDRKADLPGVTQAGEGLLERLARSRAVAGREKDHGNHLCRRLLELRIVRGSRQLQRSLGIVDRAIHVAASNAHDRAPRQRDRGLVVRGAVGQELICHPGSLVPTTSVDRVGQKRPADTEPDEGAMAEILGDTSSLLHFRERSIDVAEDQVHHPEIVVRPDHPGNIFRLGGKRDALLQFDEPTWIAHECDSRSPDVDECVRAKVVETELLGHRDRLPAKLDRIVVAIGEHLVARSFAEDVHLHA